MAYKCQSALVGGGRGWEVREREIPGPQVPPHPLWFPFVHFYSKVWSVYGCACWPGTYGHSKSISISSIPIQGSCQLYGCEGDAKPGRVSLWLHVPSRIHGPWEERTSRERWVQDQALGSATNETQPWQFFKFFTPSLPVVGSGSRVPLTAT